MIGLVDEQDLAKITVADVAERADVSRSTFYDHYRDVHELAEAACTAMIDDLIESLPVFSHDPAGQDPTQSLQAFFASLAEHAGLYRSLLGPQGSARVIDHVRGRMTDAVHTATCRTTDDADVHAAFVAGALIGVAADWLQRGCLRTPTEMAALTWPHLTAQYR